MYEENASIKLQIDEIRLDDSSSSGGSKANSNFSVDDRILKIVKLANLHVSEKNINDLKINEILSFIDAFLNRFDNENVDETSQITNLVNVTKNDETSPSLAQEEALSNTKSKHNGLFKIKAVFENE